jgi:hypothetical protein
LLERAMDLGQISVRGSVHADSGLNLNLGTAAPVVKQLGFSDREGGATPYTTQVAA